MKRDLQTKRRDNDDLRRVVDGNDQFFRGHDIRTPRNGGREPEPWMLNGYALRKFLLTQFPLSYVLCGRDSAGDHRELVTGCGGSNPRCRFCRQSRRAAQWMFMIQVCFRMRMSAEAAADYWNWDHDKPISAAYVRRLIQLITEAARKGEKPHLLET